MDRMKPVTVIDHTLRRTKGGRGGDWREGSNQILTSKREAKCTHVREPIEVMFHLNRLIQSCGPYGCWAAVGN